jgi:hypothetical protein
VQFLVFWVRGNGNAMGTAIDEDHPGLVCWLWQFSRDGSENVAPGKRTAATGPFRGKRDASDDHARTCARRQPNGGGSLCTVRACR